MENEAKEPAMDYGKVYTYADYLTMEIEERIEIIKGKIFKMAPAPARLHQKVSSNLLYYVLTFFNERPCDVYSAPFDVRLIDPKKMSKKDEDVITVVQPDLCVICDESKLDDRGCIGAPDLVVEILSPGNSKKELKNKFELYEENGVKEYWIVDYREKTILVYKLENGKYIGLKPLIEDEAIISPLFPKLSFELKNIFNY